MIYFWHVDIIQNSSFDARNFHNTLLLMDFFDIGPIACNARVQLCHDLYIYNDESRPNVRLRLGLFSIYTFAIVCSNNRIEGTQIESVLLLSNPTFN